MYDYHVPILIVGGGPVGLAISLFLSRLEISSLLVERHATTTIHPRARGMNIRTMEVFRSMGLAETMHTVGSIVTMERYTLSVDTLAGEEFQRILPQGNADNYAYANKISPESWCLCAQDELEPLLRAAAQQHGSEIHFGTELTSFEQDATGIIAHIVERATGVKQTVHAEYLIAADGANSHVRQILQVPMLGKGILAYYINMYFRADLLDLVQDRQFIMCHVENPEARGIFFTVNDTDRWLFNVSYEPAKGEMPADFTNERCIDIVRKAVGVPDLDVEILSILPWESATCIAENYFLNGRVFLVGDAAHIMPPFGASGVNIGVQDVHNLAWKLAMVLKGKAGPALLTTYHTERRSIGDLTIEQAGFRHKGIMARSSSDDISKAAPTFEEQIKVMLGYRYASPAIIAEAAASSTTSGFDGQPGTRAPHLWVELQDKRCSIFDVFGSHFVLLTGEANTAWQNAAQHVSQHLNIDLDTYSVGSTGDLVDRGNQWCAMYGITPEGAVLVRPDGFVAWRTSGKDATPERTLEHVLAQILARSDDSSYTALTSASTYLL